MGNNPRLRRLTLWEKVRLWWIVQKTLLRVRLLSLLSSWVLMKCRSYLLAEVEARSSALARTEGSERGQPRRAQSCQGGLPSQRQVNQWHPERCSKVLRRLERCRRWFPVLCAILRKWFLRGSTISKKR